MHSGTPGASPFMSTSAMPSVFVAQVPGPEGNMIPMMFTGLPLAMAGPMGSSAYLPSMGSSAMLPVISASTSALPSSPSAVSATRPTAHPEAVASPFKEDTNTGRFDFINTAITGAKQK